MKTIAQIVKTTYIYCHAYAGIIILWNYYYYYRYYYRYYWTVSSRLFLIAPHVKFAIVSFAA